LELVVPGEPFLLAIGSHKGGTGRTTTACALAWLWGRAGFRVTLADADPIRAAGLIALDDTGACHWPNVNYADGIPESGATTLNADIVVVDCATMMDPEVPAVLGRCHGVVLTCLADPLSLRTVPAAAGVLATARVANPRLELLGVLIGQYSALDLIQAPMLARLRQMHGELMLEPPVPYDPALRDWALSPGAPLPEGPAASALEAARERIAELAQKLFHVEIRSQPVAART
jgi:cellulose biosynthesis protein BcsQ